MSLIKIYIGSETLDFVKETLTIKKENNSFINEFKVSYSSFPFLVVENEKTKRLLGNRDLTSVNKPQTISVKVDEGGFLSYGELQILAYPKGFRKCNLKYASDLLRIANKKISEFMPVISVIPGENNPQPYSETVDNPIAQQTAWQTFHFPFINKCFPETKWQLPVMNWKDKYEISEDNEDEWYAWGGSYNKQAADGKLELNTFVNTSTGRLFSNRNIIAPQVFLLSPLYYILESIGYKIKGEAYNSEFVKRILMLSKNDNMSTIKPASNPPVNINAQPLDGTGRRTITIIANRAGTYTFKLEATIPPVSGTTLGARMYDMSWNLQGYPIILIFERFNNGPGFDAEGQFEFDVAPSEVGREIRISYYHKDGLLMSPFSMTYEVSDVNTGHQANTTIDFSRFVPEWTVAQYITELKNFLNLDTDFDDFKKEMTINFNRDKLVSAEKHIVEKSLEVSVYEPSGIDAFHLKYDNESDVSLWITKDGADEFTDQTSTLLQSVASKFKFVNHNGLTAQLSEDLMDKSGVGLMIYDPVNSPYVSKTYNQQTLKIEGENGIYEEFHKKWLKFRLSAGIIEVRGPFSETEINKIKRAKRIYIDRQDYFIIDSEYSETAAGNYLLKLKMASVNI